MNPTERFSDRVTDYVRYRPGYPDEVVKTLQRECGLTPGWTVADIGSGPGNLTRLFLQNGNRVFGVEPNGPMRAAGERQLAAYPEFVSVDGTAEATTLPSASVDLVTAGQAFHWFDREATREEFVRILRPGGWVALIWNERLTGGSAFLEGYEAILREHSNDYNRVNHAETAAEPAIREFFAPNEVQVARIPYEQRFNREGLRGRARSSSYVPSAGPVHDAIFAKLDALFDRTAISGEISFSYTTQVYFGKLK